MDIDNQQAYWDKVADHKTFSHPVDVELLKKYVATNATVIDFGCGYGRVVDILLHGGGFANITGYDTSSLLVKRGVDQQLPLQFINEPTDLPVKENSVDCIILFAVLTCIPSNKGQQSLINLLHSKLKPGAILYISDYYLQDSEISKSRYTNFNDNPANFGVFTLPEGATFRHHTKEWVATLVKDFKILEEHIIEVKTMNGNKAEAFQLILQK
ncbi:MAG: class I SAM-dependent methyltransferase [Ferruginibacter sp.]